MKKSFFLFVLFTKVLFATEYDCPFCRPEIIERQSYYEDDRVIGLYTHKPCVDGHCLIIPKRHVERYEDLTDEEVLNISQLIKKTHLAVKNAYGKEECLLLEKNGKYAGQDV